MVGDCQTAIVGIPRPDRAGKSLTDSRWRYGYVHRGIADFDAWPEFDGLPGIEQRSDYGRIRDRLEPRQHRHRQYGYGVRADTGINDSDQYRYPAGSHQRKFRYRVYRHGLCRIIGGDWTGQFVGSNDHYERAFPVYGAASRPPYSLQCLQRLDHGAHALCVYRDSGYLRQEGGFKRKHGNDFEHRNRYLRREGDDADCLTIWRQGVHQRDFEQLGPAEREYALGA